MECDAVEVPDGGSNGSRPYPAYYRDRFSSVGRYFHAMTRCVGVWFAYMAMEGFIHTRNLKNYLIRLWSWALIMFAGNSLLNALFASKGVMVTNNIFFTLAIGVTMLWIGFPRKELDKKEKLWLSDWACWSLDFRLSFY